MNNAGLIFKEIEDSVVCSDGKMKNRIGYDP